jgi:hypothetical protein
LAANGVRYAEPETDRAVVSETVVRAIRLRWPAVAEPEGRPAVAEPALLGGPGGRPAAGFLGGLGGRPAAGFAPGWAEEASAQESLLVASLVPTCLFNGS